MSDIPFGIIIQIVYVLFVLVVVYYIIFVKPESSFFEIAPEDLTAYTKQQQLDIQNLRERYMNILLNYYIQQVDGVNEEVLKQKIRWKMLVQFTVLKYALDEPACIAVWDEFRQYSDYYLTIVRDMYKKQYETVLGDLDTEFSDYLDSEFTLQFFIDKCIDRLFVFKQLNLDDQTAQDEAGTMLEFLYEQQNTLSQTRYYFYINCADIVSHLQGQPRYYILVPPKVLDKTLQVEVYDITEAINDTVTTTQYFYKLIYDDQTQQYKLNKNEKMIGHYQYQEFYDFMVKNYRGEQDFSDNLDLLPLGYTLSVLQFVNKYNYYMVYWKSKYFFLLNIFKEGFINDINFIYDQNKSVQTYKESFAQRYHKQLTDTQKQGINNLDDPQQNQYTFQDYVTGINPILVVSQQSPLDLSRLLDQDPSLFVELNEDVIYSGKKRQLFKKKKELQRQIQKKNEKRKLNKIRMQLLQNGNTNRSKKITKQEDNNEEQQYKLIEFQNREQFVQYVKNDKKKYDLFCSSHGIVVNDKLLQYRSALFHFARLVEKQLMQQNQILYDRKNWRFDTYYMLPSKINKHCIDCLQTRIIDNENNCIGTGIDRKERREYFFSYDNLKYLKNQDVDTEGQAQGLQMKIQDYNPFYKTTEEEQKLEIYQKKQEAIQNIRKSKKLAEISDHYYYFVDYIFNHQESFLQIANSSKLRAQMFKDVYSDEQMIVDDQNQDKNQIFKNQQRSKRKYAIFREYQEKIRDGQFMTDVDYAIFKSLISDQTNVTQITYEGGIAQTVINNIYNNVLQQENMSYLDIMRFYYEIRYGFGDIDDNDTIRTMENIKKTQWLEQIQIVFDYYYYEAEVDILLFKNDLDKQIQNNLQCYPYRFMQQINGVYDRYIDKYQKNQNGEINNIMSIDLFDQLSTDIQKSLNVRDIDDEKRQMVVLIVQDFYENHNQLKFDINIFINRIRQISGINQYNDLIDQTLNQEKFRNLQTVNIVVILDFQQDLKKRIYKKGNKDQTVLQNVINGIYLLVQEYQQMWKYSFKNIPINPSNGILNYLQTFVNATNQLYNQYFQKVVQRYSSKIQQSYLVVSDIYYMMRKNIKDPQHIQILENYMTLCLQNNQSLLTMKKSSLIQYMNQYTNYTQVEYKQHILIDNVLPIIVYNIGELQQKHNFIKQLERQDNQPEFDEDQIKAANQQLPSNIRIKDPTSGQGNVYVSTSNIQNFDLSQKFKVVDYKTNFQECPGRLFIDDLEYYFNFPQKMPEDIEVTPYFQSDTIGTILNYMSKIQSSIQASTDINQLNKLTMKYFDVKICFMLIEEQKKLNNIPGLQLPPLIGLSKEQPYYSEEKKALQQIVQRSKIFFMQYFFDSINSYFYEMSLARLTWRQMDDLVCTQLQYKQISPQMQQMQQSIMDRIKEYQKRQQDGYLLVKDFNEMIQYTLQDIDNVQIDQSLQVKKVFLRTVIQQLGQNIGQYKSQNLDSYYVTYNQVLKFKNDIYQLQRVMMEQSGNYQDPYSESTIQLKQFGDILKAQCKYMTDNRIFHITTEQFYQLKQQCDQQLIGKSYQNEMLQQTQRSYRAYTYKVINYLTISQFALLPVQLKQHMVDQMKNNISQYQIDQKMLPFLEIYNDFKTYFNGQYHKFSDFQIMKQNVINNVNNKNNLYDFEKKILIDEYMVELNLNDKNYSKNDFEQLFDMVYEELLPRMDIIVQQFNQTTYGSGQNLEEEMEKAMNIFNIAYQSYSYKAQTIGFISTSLIQQMQKDCLRQIRRSKLFASKKKALDQSLQETIYNFQNSGLTEYFSVEYYNGIQQKVLTRIQNLLYSDKYIGPMTEYYKQIHDQQHLIFMNSFKGQRAMNLFISYDKDGIEQTSFQRYSLNILQTINNNQNLYFCQQQQNLSDLQFVINSISYINQQYINVDQSLICVNLLQYIYDIDYFLYNVLDPGFFQTGDIQQEFRKFRGYRIDVDSTNTIFNITVLLGAFSFTYDFILQILYELIYGKFFYMNGRVDFGDPNNIIYNRTTYGLYIGTGYQGSNQNIRMKYRYHAGLQGKLSYNMFEMRKDINLDQQYMRTPRLISHKLSTNESQWTYTNYIGSPCSPVDNRCEVESSDLNPKQPWPCGESHDELSCYSKYYDINSCWHSDTQYRYRNYCMDCELIKKTCYDVQNKPYNCDYIQCYSPYYTGWSGWTNQWYDYAHQYSGTPSCGPWPDYIIPCTWCSETQYKYKRNCRQDYFHYTVDGRLSIKRDQSNVVGTRRMSDLLINKMSTRDKDGQPRGHRVYMDDSFMLMLFNTMSPGPADPKCLNILNHPKISALGNAITARYGNGQEAQQILTGMLQALNDNMQRGRSLYYNFSSLFYLANANEYILKVASRWENHDGDDIGLKVRCTTSNCSFIDVRGRYYITYNYLLRFCKQHRYKKNFDTGLKDIITMYQEGHNQPFQIKKYRYLELQTQICQRQNNKGKCVLHQCQKYLNGYNDYNYTNDDQCEIFVSQYTGHCKILQRKDYQEEVNQGLDPDPRTKYISCDIMCQNPNYDSTNPISQQYIPCQEIDDTRYDFECRELVREDYYDFGSLPPIIMKVKYEQNRANIYNVINPVIFGKGTKQVVSEDWQWIEIQQLENIMKQVQEQREEFKHPLQLATGVFDQPRYYTFGFELLLEPYMNLKIRGYRDMKHHWENCPRGSSCPVKLCSPSNYFIEPYYTTNLQYECFIDYFVFTDLNSWYLPNDEVPYLSFANNGLPECEKIYVMTPELNDGVNKAPEYLKAKDDRYDVFMMVENKFMMNTEVNEQKRSEWNFGSRLTPETTILLFRAMQQYFITIKSPYEVQFRVQPTPQLLFYLCLKDDLIRDYFGMKELQNYQSGSPQYQQTMQKIYSKFYQFLESMNLDNFNEITLNFTFYDMGTDQNFCFGNVPFDKP